MKRSIRFYRRNEQQVMRKLGFNPTKNSGAGDIEKEDGENDVAICQLKSTDAQSISIRQKDLQVLEYHASVSHKIPVFAIQFLNTGEVWLLTRPKDTVLIEDEKINIFDEDNQKTVDMDQEKEYNIRELSEAQNKRAEAREAYNKMRQKEHEQNEKAYKEGRKKARKKSLTKRG